MPLFFVFIIFSAFCVFWILLGDLSEKKLSPKTISFYFILFFSYHPVDYVGAIYLAPSIS